MPPAALPNPCAAASDAPCVVLVPAAARTRQCVTTENLNYMGMAVTDRSRGADCELTWDMLAETGGWYEIWVEYAAQDSRPMRIMLDQDVLLHFGLAETTGGWTEADQVWHLQDTAFLTTGLHRITFTRIGDIPHIRAVAFLPIERPANVPNADDRASPEIRTAREPSPARRLRVRGPERVLVCVLAQTRAHQHTWLKFRKNVLDEFDADLALAIGIDDDYDYANPFWQHAKFRWTSREFSDYGEAFDLVQQHLAAGQPVGGDWRDILAIEGLLLGGIRSKKPHLGSGAILLYYRWLLLHKLIADGVLENYDRFVITRSDFVWDLPHPPLSVLAPSDIWFPDGEYHGGLTDRHLVVSRQDLPNVINLIDNLLLHPARMLAQLSNRDYNLELYIRAHLRQQDLLWRTSVFPWIMYSVRGEQDKTTWATGVLDTDLGAYVKYESERASTDKYKQRISTRRDWERLFIEDPSRFRRVGWQF
jgi:hypothetical protein